MDGLDVTRALRSAIERADHHADRARRRERQARRPRARRRRLRHEAVQSEGTRGARAAVFRRVDAAAERGDIIRAGDVTLDKRRMQASVGGARDRSDLDGVRAARDARRGSRAACSRARSSSTRSAAWQVESFDRAIDAHVKNVRRKLEPDPRNPRYLLTVHGVGYKFTD